MDSLQIIQQSTGHTHPLTRDCSEKEFLCHGCSTLGNGPRYRCNYCDFNLHELCANCPTELFKRFMHDHPLILVFNPQSAPGQVTKNCNLCGDRVQGLFYGCNNSTCDFNVHPFCTQLPEYVLHVKDKAHGLRLQRSFASASCVVCKNACPPWRYRCGICCLDLHLECVLAPCEKVESTSTPRDHLISPVPRPPPSTWNPSFLDAYHYDYGANNYIPPPYFNTYAPSHGYNPPPHPALYAPSHGYNPPPHPALYAPSHGYNPPPHPALYAPTHGTHGYNPPPHPALYAPSHGYGANIPPNPYGAVPASPYSGSHHQQQQSSTNGQQVHHGGGGGFGKKMYAIITALATGVASNALFGAISS